MKVAIIGCGLIGQKRASALGAAELAVTCDVIPERAAALARTVKDCKTAVNWETAVTSPSIDIVVIATTHDLLAPIAAAAAANSKHVLIEKPGARSSAELDCVAEAAARTGVSVRVGFNHRYHRALRKAREVFDSDLLGPLMFIRGRYGHGGRIGYDKEWRSRPEISGGGELIDQGMHLIDLARWFLGDFVKVQGSIATFYWDMPVEDNGFLLLETAQGQTAFLHASCTEWKNLFSLEIYGRNGKLEINGLGGSYGPERLAYYQMLPQMGPPPTTIWEYPMPDDSWQAEFQDFLEDIRLGRQPDPGIAAAQASLRVVETVYAEAEKRTVIAESR
ncbi:MAG: Gfo/Idh/MocA family oxidoreductase [Bryobacterales bacterium]|nr:Gfo/Idh/MocA family oxidoreductase [Bryobacterales bacterium]